MASNKNSVDFFIFTCSCLHLTNRDLAFICFLFSLLLAILLLCWQYLPKQINFLCPAKIPRFVRERSWIWFSLIRVCFLLNKALRLFRVCAEDSVFSTCLCESVYDRVIISFLNQWHSSAWALANHSLLQRNLNTVEYNLRCTCFRIKPFIIIFYKSSSLKLESCYYVMYLMDIVLVLITYLIVVLFPVWGVKKERITLLCEAMPSYFAVVSGSLRSDDSNVPKSPVLPGWVWKCCKVMKS